MTFNIYLSFQDNCAEAFDFYKSIFGGDYEVIQKFSDGPPDMPLAEEDKDKIMHATLKVGDAILMGSDTPSQSPHPLQVGNNFSISYHCASRDEADRIFAALTKGGSVSMPMEDMFWGSYFGSGTDKFGINWMIDFQTE